MSSNLEKENITTESNGDSLPEASETSSNYLEQELVRIRELNVLKSKENLQLESKLAECEQQAALKIEQLNQDFTLKLEHTLKTFQECQLDKQSSLVMKYAAGEKRCIDLSRKADLFQSKLNESNKEKSSLNEKYLKMKQDLEKQSLELDKKCQETLKITKECERLKGELVLSEIREKANQMKLTTIDEKQYEETVKSLKSLESSLNDVTEERNTLRDRLKCMDQERIRNNDLLRENESQLENYRQTINKGDQDSNDLKIEIETLKSELNNIQFETLTSQEKQSDLLLFTSKLTEKNSQLQTENQILNEKLEQLQNELIRNQPDNSIQSELNKLNEQFKNELNKNKKLEDDLKKKEIQIEDLSTKLLDEQDELNTLKKRHANNIKDLTKQLQQLQKKPISVPIDEPTQCSIACEALNDIQPSLFNETCAYSDDVYVVDVDKQKLIDKIFKLQKIQAKNSEKIDFLQDHVNQLTSDVKRKTKIIQVYAMNQEGGMFTSESHDSLKRQISRKVSNLASAFAFNSTTEANIQSEINTKLQSLLEDTLIKNITLKENIETLGQEISNLKRRY